MFARGPLSGPLAVCEGARGSRPAPYGLSHVEQFVRGQSVSEETVRSTGLFVRKSVAGPRTDPPRDDERIDDLHTYELWDIYLRAGQNPASLADTPWEGRACMSAHGGKMFSWRRDFGHVRCTGRVQRGSGAGAAPDPELPRLQWTSHHTDCGGRLCSRPPQSTKI